MVTGDRHAGAGWLILPSALLLAGCECSGIVRATAADGAADEGDAGRPSRGDGGADASRDGIVDGPRSGARIKVRGWAAEDVVTPSGVLWDDERGVECSLASSTDGALRCLPTVPRSRGAEVASVWFTDPNCLNPVLAVVAFDCAPPARYVIDSVSLSCPPSATSVYRPGAPLEPPMELYHRSASGCLPSSSSDAARFFEAVPSPPGDWVRFDRALSKVTSRLGVLYWDGSDGSRFLEGLRLLPEDVPCGERLTSPGVTRCVPSNSVDQTFDYFDDDSCLNAVGLGACEPPDVIWGYDREPPDFPLCPPFVDTRLPYRAKPVSSSTVHTTSGGAGCTPTEYGGFKHYALGEPIPIENYPVLETTHEGTGRFHTIYLASEGLELHALAEELYDTQAARSCTITRLLTDQRVFCVPDSAMVSDRSDDFADSACTVRLPTVDQCASEPPVAVAVHERGADCVNLASSLRRIMGLHDGPVFEQTSPSGCSPAPVVSGMGHYEIGESVDPAALFPLVTEQAL